MPLSEPRAWELLRDHTSVLRGRLHRCDRSHDVDADELPPLQFENPGALDDGARVRLACDLITTLGACDGFGPSENPSFWRRVVCDLILPNPHNQPPFAVHELPRLDNAWRCMLVLNVWDLDEPEATAFWREFITCGDQSQDESAINTQRDRDALARELGPFMVRNVKPLELRFRCPHWSLLEDPGDALGSVLQCVRDLHTQRQVSLARGVAIDAAPLSTMRDVRIELVLVLHFERRRGFQDDVDTIARVVRTCTEWAASTRIDAIEIFGSSSSVSPKISARHAQIRVVCTLTRAAPRLPSLVLTNTVGPYAVFGAAMSAVPHQDKLLRLAWLAYAIFHPKCRHQRTLQSVAISSSWGFRLDSDEIQYIEDIVRAGQPLRDVVNASWTSRYGPRSRPTNVVLYPFGVSAIVTRGTALYCEPGRTAARYLVITVDYDEEVDVVAHVATKAFVGSDLEMILASCPNLQYLEIRQCVIQSLWPLVDAYADEQHPCRVSSLKLASTGTIYDDTMVRVRCDRDIPARALISTTPVNVFGPLMAVLCDAAHPLTQRLRVLHVDLRGTAQEDEALEQLTQALSLNTTRLETLSVNTQATSASHVARQLGHRRDAVVVDARRMRLALLSVVRVTATTTSRVVSRPLSADSLSLVFAFAGGSVLRHISWLFCPLKPMNRSM